MTLKRLKIWLRKDWKFNLEKAENMTQKILFRNGWKFDWKKAGQEKKYVTLCQGVGDSNQHKARCNFTRSQIDKVHLKGHTI